MLLIGIITLIPYYYVNDLGGNKYLTNYYSLFLITPPMVKLFNCCRRFNILYRFFEKIGKYSLEIYLVQVTIMPKIICYLLNNNTNSTIIVIISVMIVTFVSFLVKKVSLFINYSYGKNF